MNSHVFSGESKMNQAHACGLLVCDLELFVIFFLQCIILCLSYLCYSFRRFLSWRIYIYVSCVFFSVAF